MMKKASYAILLLIVVLVSFLAGRHYSRGSSGAKTASRRVLYYVDPMHPAYKSDKPGIAPDCGMQLEPVYEDGAAVPSSGASPTIAGGVQISPEKQQLIGVRMAQVEKSPGTRAMRVLGRVSVDENRVYRILTGSEGWIRSIDAGTTGSLVQHDQVLATLYNRDFLTAEQGLIYAMNSLDRFKKEGMDSPEQIASTNNQIAAAEDNLRALGMGETQIREIARTRKISREIEVRAPVAGLVVARSVFPGLRFERSTELYRIVDLSRVWILADLYENEAQYFRPGTTARITVPHQSGSFNARVSDVPPQFDPAARTLKVRLECNNPGFALRPDMFVDVELPIGFPPAITVPADAVLDSGLRTTVFVDRGNGYFEPRKIETGWRSGDRVQILKGLMEGERVVVSGTFLVDSESRLKAAAAGMYGTPTKDPVCGMEVDESKAIAAGRKAEYQGTTYYFCSEECKRKFDRAPDAYGKKKPVGTTPAVEQVASTTKDPACGMEVDVAKARAAGRTAHYQGRSYFFCSSSCKEKFEKDPERYLRKLTGQKPPESSTATGLEGNGHD